MPTNILVTHCPPSLFILSDLINTKNHLVSFKLLLTGSMSHFEHAYLFTIKQAHSSLPELPIREEISLL